MITVGIKVADGVKVPLYDSPLHVGFDLLAKNFKKLFKGNKEVMLNKKLQQSLSEGYLTLRGFERALVGTGMEITVPEGYELQIRDKPGPVLKKGLMVAGSPMTIGSDYRGELAVTLINNSPFLCKIRLGDVIAQVVASRIQHIKWEVSHD
jgi:dUTP pyrophosphatase